MVVYLLEAWGNAKTVRNDNSSRFGKFIRIHFNQSGKLSGADMVVYLLEKSRLTYQQPLERCYHAFYNIMSDQVPDLKEKCLLSDDILDYWFVSQGKLTVPSIDDKEDMQFADEAFDILGFSEDEKYDVFKCTAALMHMGNMTKDFVPVGKEEQAEIKDDINAQKVAGLCGIDCEWMITYFCKPKLKVGTEWVQKGSICTGAASSVSGIARGIYERSFRLVVDKCNETLCDPTMKKVTYIGVLDIAGFEIFDYNGFEQICINYVNEKLQQFFNQHMFTLEQEEYVKEGLDWANVDFGMDLQKCIDMFEKPMAFLAIFEEESLFPKATDKTFAEKLMSNMLGKWSQFAMPNPRPDPDAHFAVIHYAATVSYNLTGWLEKNKDPLNDTIVEMIKNGSNSLMVRSFADQPGQPLEAPKDQDRKKKGGGKTVSSFFKSQLDDLMTTLYKTEPHFIRCVVPNTHKQPGGVESELVMHQYQCNGVLAGIAICRAGFPNKMLYPEFKARYNILGASLVAKAKNDKAAAGAVLDLIKLPVEKFRLGHTKVFFRAGILGVMEETREDKIGSVLSWLQAGARGKASRMNFKKLQDQKLALYACQRAIRNFFTAKTWLWMQIWLAIKPNLKCTQFGKFKKEFEDKIALAEANIDGALEARSKVQAVYDGLAGQKNELSLALKSGGSAVQEIIDKTTRIEGQAAEVQNELTGVQTRIKGEKAQKVALEGQIGKINATVAQMEAEVQNQEGVLKSAEQDRADKDDQIKTLKDEIGHQADMISKLGKEKRSVGDGRQKTEEDIQAAEDKCNHLSKVKGKLEQCLDESEDALEREKKVKGDVEKAKRKIEEDLKLTQEAVSDLERVKAELSGAVARKEKEGSALGAKIDDEATLASKYAKQAKELMARLEELDEELNIERGSRAKAEKSRTMLKKDIEDIGSRLEEAGSNTATQVELNKKREAELGRIKAELEELKIANEGTLGALRMKHNNTMGDLGEQIDSLNSNKVKSEKDKAGLELDLRDARLDLEDAVKGKAELDKTGKLLQGSIVDSNSRLDEMARALNEAESTKKRLQVENQDLNRQIEELEAAIANMNKGKISVTTQLEDSKALADAEAKDRASLLTKFKMMSTDLENLREKLENEAMRKSDAMKALSKAHAEIQLWKSRYETEGMGRIEELEGARAKLQAKIVENEELVDVLQTKVANAEKSKGRLGSDLDDISMEYERVHAAALITEKRAKNFDKVLGEWLSKANDVQAEVAASQDEGRNYSSELFRLKAAQDEAVEQLDIVKRENKNLADEIKDLLDQLGEGGRSIHDLDKQRRRLETEKEELQAALEEAEATLEMEENKVLRAQLELAQVKQEIDRRVAEKEDEFNNTRKNHARAMDSIGASIETEQRAKGEAIRVKKQLEGEINELEIGLDHANKANSEGLKSIKRYQGQLRETIQLFEDEARAKAQITEQVGISERKAASLSGEVEESKALLDGADRAQRQLQGDIADARGAVNNMQTINGRDMTAEAMPKLITQSEMLQKVNEQNTEKTTIYTNKEVQDFMMSAGNVDSTSDQNGLVLPKAYTTLLKIFESFDTVLRFCNNRGEKAVWTKIRLSVKNTSEKFRNFTKHQLGQMKYILPSAFDLKVEKVTSYKSRNIRNDFEIIIKPVFDGGVVSEGIKKMDYTICKKRLKQFKLNLLALVKCEHHKFLASIGINDLKHKKIVEWHKNFNVNESAVQIPNASVPSADSLNSQSSCVRKMLIETKKQKDEQVAEVRKLLIETKEEEKTIEKTPKFLQKVPEALLRSVREKEKNRNIRNMINNHVGSKKLQQLEKLPEIAPLISLFYRIKERSCLKHEEMLRHLSTARKSTIHETEQLLDLLVGNCDGWLQIIDISDTKYVKKMKVDMSVQQVNH